MLVVADTSPLIALVNIGHTEVLATLFREIVVPPAVVAEISSPARSAVVRQFADAIPPWLRTQTPATLLALPRLHPGEVQALSLALEASADLLLIDERRAYREAQARGMAVVGTVGVLERAASQGLLDLHSAFESLKHSDFWISHRLLDRRLQLFRQGNGPSRR